MVLSLASQGKILFIAVSCRENSRGGHEQIKHEEEERSGDKERCKEGERKYSMHTMQSQGNNFLKYNFQIFEIRSRLF